MSIKHLHIKDALQGASPGTLIASSETTTLYGPLRALIGRDATNLVLTRAGRAGVLFMSETELVHTTGITPEFAKRIVVARRLFDACRRTTAALQSSKHVVEALPVGLSTLEVEVLLAIAMTGTMKPIATVLLAKGGATGASITPRDVFTPLLRLGASVFVLVHNHPSGSASPSREDIVLTNTIARLGRALGVELVDHLIVGGDEVCSFADLGLLLGQDELKSLELNDGL